MPGFPALPCTAHSTPTRITHARASAALAKKPPIAGAGEIFPGGCLWREKNWGQNLFSALIFRVFEFWRLFIKASKVKNLLTHAHIHTHTYTHAYPCAHTHARTHAKFQSLHLQSKQTLVIKVKPDDLRGGGTGYSLPKGRLLKKTDTGEKVGFREPPGRLSGDGYSVLTVGSGVCRGRVTGNRPSLAASALPPCPRIGLSSCAPAVGQSHSSRVNSAAPCRRTTPDNAAACDNSAAKLNSVSDMCNRAETGMLTVLTMLRQKCIECFSKADFGWLNY